MDGNTPVNQDKVQIAKFKLGSLFIESVFYRAALEAGFGRRSEERAQTLLLMYTHGGFDNLPRWCKDTIETYCQRSDSSNSI